MPRKTLQISTSCLSLIAIFLAWVLQVPATHAAGFDLSIVVDQEQLTMRVQDAPLVDVVERVTQLLFLTSHLDPKLEPMLVTLSIKDLPFRQGIAQLLANTNYVLTDRDLYVWARGESAQPGQWRERQQELDAVPQELEERPEMSEEELRYQALHGEDPEARVTALELLNSEGEEKAMATLVEALSDENPEVRGMALELLSESEGPLPIEQIAKIVANDPNPEQRMEAIVVIASRDEEAAKAILHNALQDSDPEVVELAKSILQEVDTYAEDEDVR